MRSVQPEIQYADLDQQTETAQLGMWVFIATEVLFFGGLFFTYVVYRNLYWEQFVAAARDSKLLLGSINAAILLTSSLTMVVAIAAVAASRNRLAVILLLATAFLGVLFLGVKGYEYFEDYLGRVVPAVNFTFRPGFRGPAELYWVFYWIATAIHAVHLSIGVAIVLVMARRTERGDFTPAYYSPLEVTGLYWSFVDAIWIFLFAFIYPWGRSGG